MGLISPKKSCPIMLLFKFILQIVISTAADASRSVIINTEPRFIHDLVEGDNRSALLSIQLPEEKLKHGDWSLDFKPLRQSMYNVAEVDHALHFKSSAFQYDEVTKYFNISTPIVLKGNRMGKTAYLVHLVRADGTEDSGNDTIRDEYTSEETFDIWVRRSAGSEKLTHYFVMSVVTLIILANIMMGCEIDMNVVVSTIRRPLAPFIGFLTQFVIMPLLAYGIAIFVFMPRGLPSMALGIFITGCSPGGGASNYWTLLLDGNVNLSVTMTFVSTVLSLVMMPLWLSWLGSRFLGGFSSQTQMKVPYANITRSLFVLVLPLLIGVAIQRFKPTWAIRARQVMRPFIIFVLVFVVLFGCISNSYMFYMMSWPAIFGGLLLPWCGFMFGCFASILFRQSPSDVTAIAIETGIQNTGVSIFLLKASFAQPDADIGSVIPVIVACFTPIPLLLGAAVHTMLKMLKKRRQTIVDCEVQKEASVEMLSAANILIPLPEAQS
ncbi:unnamed protein product [Auanema sp. JU1783]|nr:unnamed protein product [Auanema sp. JU1783]